MKIWTIGHSTRSIDEFLAVLAAHDISLVADVRRFPASRRLPHFAAGALERSLGEASIAYRWLPSLGGRRSTRKDSPNGGWRVAGFRGYADHTATEEFAEALFELTMLAAGLHTAVMCAEVLWWQCHRRIIADVLVAQDIEVVHIRDAEKSDHHELKPPARLVRGHLRWPAA